MRVPARVMADRTEGRVEAGGKSLEYRRWGSSSTAPTIVMLHEGLGSISSWKDFPAMISKDTGLDVVAYSRAGHGCSEAAAYPRPLDYMTREAVDVLPDVLDGLSIGRCVLAGHSDGATIAAVHAGSVSDMRVRGLILMAPHFFAEPEGLAEIARVRAAWRTGGLKERLSRHHDDAEAVFRGWSGAWLDRGFRDWTVADAIDHLRVPTLAIQGRDDAYGTLAQISELEERSPAPVETLILDDCGHSPHRDRSGAVRAEIAGFIGRLRRIEAAGAGIA